MTQGNKTFISDIAGGTKPIAREIGDYITIQHIWDIYRWVPGFRDMLNLEVDAIFSNGINDDNIDETRIIECKEALRWALMAGYSTVIVDARNPDKPKIEAWNPTIDGVGFEFTKTKFSARGHPTEITIHLKSNEAGAEGIHIPVPHYPCAIDIDGEFIDDEPEPNGYGFFHLRTDGSLKGVQGLPQYLHLLDVFKGQWDILKAYIPFAEKQGMGFPVYFHEDNTKTNRANVKAQWSTQPTTNRIMQMSMKDGVEYIQPLAGSYDPFPMLQRFDHLISRATQMNKLMLEGDPAGALASSDTAVARWEAKNKEKQSYWRTQFKGIWLALGADEEVNFADPTKPSFISLMEGLKAMREAMDGLVEPEDIVERMNAYLEVNDQKAELHAISKEEMMMAEMAQWEGQQQKAVAGQSTRKGMRGKDESNNTK